jgi:hypothetical protein
LLFVASTVGLKKADFYQNVDLLALRQFAHFGLLGLLGLLGLSGSSPFTCIFVTSPLEV